MGYLKESNLRIHGQTFWCCIHTTMLLPIGGKFSFPGGYRHVTARTLCTMKTAHIKRHDKILLFLLKIYNRKRKEMVVDVDYWIG